VSYSLTTPVTGGAQTGFTAPTYTIALDTAPQYNGKQYAVTALGGTQAGVSANNPSIPFTLNFVRPVSLKTAAAVKAGSNSLVANNRNKWGLILRKGGLVNSGSVVYGTAIIRTEFDIAAGMETASPAELRGMISFLVGALSQVSAGLGDTLATGVV